MQRRATIHARSFEEPTLASGSARISLQGPTSVSSPKQQHSGSARQSECWNAPKTFRSECFLRPTVNASAWCGQMQRSISEKTRDRSRARRSRLAHCACRVCSRFCARDSPAVLSLLNVRTGAHHREAEKRQP
jgi:hypothetical protein